MVKRTLASMIIRHQTMSSPSSFRLAKRVWAVRRCAFEVERLAGPFECSGAGWVSIFHSVSVSEVLSEAFAVWCPVCVCFSCAALRDLPISSVRALVVSTGSTRRNVHTRSTSPLT